MKIKPQHEKQYRVYCSNVYVIPENVLYSLAALQLNGAMAGFYNQWITLFVITKYNMHSCICKNKNIDISKVWSAKVWIKVECKFLVMKSSHGHSLDSC